MGETFQYSSLWKGRRKEKSQKKKLLLMFLYVQLDPVHVAPKDGKVENENVSIQFNGIYPSLTARKDFCSKAKFFKLKTKYPSIQTFNIKTWSTVYKLVMSIRNPRYDIIENKKHSYLFSRVEQNQATQIRHWEPPAAQLLFNYFQTKLLLWFTI